VSSAALCRGASALVLATAVAIAALLASGCSTRAAHSAVAAVDPRPAATNFPADVVGRGERLAAIGNCITCHSVPGQPAFAGGYPVRTPFGTVHGTNLTPDPDTGIGRWSEEAFRRALREGVDRAGHNLYPAFPYDHFTRLTDDDVRALYAYLMTREPVRMETPPNDIWVPRSFVSVWKALYFRPGPDPAANAGAEASLARGRYLVDGLAHCGACHTPHNALGAEQRDRAFDGYDVDGWHAPALNAKSTSPLPWSVEALTTYLRTGIADGHAVSAGPMHGVTGNLAAADPADVAAIATYIVSLDTRTPAQREALARASVDRGTRGASPPTGNGALIYAGTCAQCHDLGRQAEGGALQLPLAIAPTLPTPANLIHIVRDGITPAPHERFPWMPGYHGALTDAQLADLVAYVRTMSGQPPWPDVAGAVRAAGKGRSAELPRGSG